MRQCKYSNMPVPIPAPASKISDLARFARECRNAFVALRDRRVIANNGSQIIGSYQWKCTPNGDDTVTVEGGALYCAAGAAEIVHTAAFFDGGEVTVTGDGHIYFKVTLTSVNYLDEATTAGVDTITAVASETGALEFIAGEQLGAAGGAVASSGYAYYPLCEVTLTDNVASVIKQFSFGPLYLSMQASIDDV